MRPNPSSSKSVAKPTRKRGEQSHLPTRQTLEKLGILRRTFARRHASGLGYITLRMKETWVKTSKRL